MKISNKTHAWVYGLAAIAGMCNSFIASRAGNAELMIAWICATGLSCGALAAYLELIRKEDEDNFPG
jgi:hypothetical protein